MLLRGDLCLKQWKCVRVDDHIDVADTIEEHQGLGWSLHTYACAGVYPPAGTIRHYLLFERGD